MIKYLGSKLRLLPGITEVVARIPDARSAVDLFSGTARVAHALKARGLRVEANDHNAYAHALAASSPHRSRSACTRPAASACA